MENMIYVGRKENLPVERNESSFYLVKDEREIYFGDELYSSLPEDDDAVYAMLAELDLIDLVQDSDGSILATEHDDAIIW